ncbi:MAG: glycoside hydrolase family 27 protein, partial [Muribaculaceae bacterium]|nr:glycoside hydrolase family 27 protein [Muribaculaceae bacterium]
MNRIATSLIALSLLPLSAMAWETPTMGWSSWNAFGHRIDEAIIRSQADALVATRLKDAGYIYVNIDDGAWCGRDADGHLRIHPTRFPNGLKPLIDHIHSSGLKAGTYSDAGHNTCASFWGGDRDGIGTGLYEHDEEDARFMFGELGFDFIKVDFCGGDGPQNSEMLDLDERERYTAISEAIKSTGRTDVRYNVCRWAYPGTWVEDVATSWRMSQDIYLGWESVKDIIHQNLYLSAYATRGRFNDMDMLEVGRGMKPEEDRTHFGMWCMMSSPLLIGCDLRQIDSEAIALLTNPELIALNQDPLALQAVVAKRENGAYILVKDVDQLRGNTRAVAFYNPTDKALKMEVGFFDLDLGEEAEVRDLFERKDLGHFSGSLDTTVPAHGTRIYRVTADRRLERRLYEAEPAVNPSSQELDNNQAVKSGIYEELDICSGGAK